MMRGFHSVGDFESPKVDVSKLSRKKNRSKVKDDTNKENVSRKDQPNTGSKLEIIESQSESRDTVRKSISK